MRKILLLGALSAVAALSLGCALSDYPALEVVNKSHGVTDCDGTQDRIANTQQTTEPAYRELFFRDPDVGGVLGPFLLTDRVDRESARDWGRFNGPSSAVLGFGIAVLGPGNVVLEGGQWEMAAVKDMPDGSVRITTYFSDVQSPYTGAFPPFSCMFGSANSSGATEGGVQSEYLTGNERLGAVAGRYVYPAIVAIDNQNAPGSYQWGDNLVAMTPDRAADNWSNMFAALPAARGAEYHLQATPVTRRAGSLGALISGSTETFTAPEDSDFAGYSATAYGEMNEQGLLLNIVSVSAPNGTVYEAGETPIRVQLAEIGDNNAQVQIDAAEALKGLIFVRDAGLADRALELPKHIEGIPLPPVAMRINGEFVNNRIQELTELLSGEGDAGFGG